MGQLLKPGTKVTVVPKDGAIEITLNINITLDGKVTATADNTETVSVQAVDETEEQKRAQFIPDFTSGMKLPTFGSTTK